MLKQIGLAVIILAIVAIPVGTAHARGGGRSGSGGGSVHVHGYSRNNGNYVQSYERSAPGTGSRNSSKLSRTASNALDETSTTPTRLATTTTGMSTQPTTKATAKTPTTGVGTLQTPVGNTVTVNPFGISPYGSSLDPNATAQRTYGALLHNAKQLIQAGIYSPAAANLQRIIGGAPGTRIAMEAQRLLSMLPTF